ncbi:sialate O-acetylesterase [Altererythrobacter sp. GH1-8]|uniref:sialate O-acetylesterase n=1 Tax=Altererythrobacter sp. GH1-8 TaxID=3349333 RepID=UPI00374CECA7
MSLGAPFTDGMVIQRGHPIPVWGWAEAGASLQVTLGDEARSATVGPDGSWLVEFAPRDAATGLTLAVVDEDEQLALSDIAMGDVVLCSGQSNMVWKMSVTALRPDDRRPAIDEKIRLLTVPQVSSLVEASRFGLPATWAKAQDKWLDFSAVCLFAGRQIAASEGVTVGLINASVGGTPIRSWLPYEGLGRAGEMEDQLAKLDSFRRDPATASAQHGVPVSDVWEQRPRPEWIHKASESYANLFNGMVAPLGPTRLAGAIWYQGENEANTSVSTAGYRSLLESLITTWRRRFGGKVPFAVVQLAGFGKLSGAADNDDWAAVREAQRVVARDDPATELVVTIDVSERLDIHPPIKKPVGQRAGAALLKLSHGRQDAYLPPEALSARHIGETVEIAVSHKNGPLYSASWGRPGPFMLCEDTAGMSCRFADAQFTDGGIAVAVPKGTQPALVRYCWDAAPICNVFDQADIPLGPFEFVVK